MIQSMEILQLPIMALQERIDEEMNENPLLEMGEQDPDLPEEPRERENPDAPSAEERELVLDEKNTEADFERLMQLNEDVPDHFDEAPRPAPLRRFERRGERLGDAIHAGVAGPDGVHGERREAAQLIPQRDVLREAGGRLLEQRLQHGLFSLLDGLGVHFGNQARQAHAR